MTKEEFSLLFHRAQVNLVAFKKLYEPEAFEAMQRMVEMAVAEEREACAKDLDELSEAAKDLYAKGFVWQAINKSAAVIRARKQA